VSKTPNAALEWARGRDTGLSSLLIFEVLSGREVFELAQWGRSYIVPWDPSDFGRCYRLLKAVPRWRKRLEKVAQKHPRWRPLVDRWDELERLWEEESPTRTCPKLFALMLELTKEAKP
jgi:hypothetical protein